MASKHPDFKLVEGSRPDWDSTSAFHYTKTVAPDWTAGSGANASHARTGSGPDTPHIAIDPHAAGRPSGFNYKFLISSVVPRPIAFLATRSADGTRNLAPFSYFNMMNHDPPMFAIGFSRGLVDGKDSLRNLAASRECTINIISEGFVEAANAACVNAPAGVSEWEIAGLTPLDDCKTVAVSRVKEAVVSIEGKVDSIREFESKANPGTKSGAIVLIEGTQFWAREDAINEEQNMVDPKILRPISRLGGITYGRTTDVIEIPRPDFDRDIGGMDGYNRLVKK
ncbi:hypothetical protein TD95_000770 [Thielaviopsis punctulata]|uniref:Flavin reductase like domain-containing protein n=1 Tax=Thielaviopsis punctulata TaxID=72032 RepID=A0A0F4Z8F7_9PEZI|nr:hypothetical protein TD95_000770 [Thielaviopsis punctulata]